MKIDRAAKPIAALNGWCDYRLWGRLAVTASCSDILAVGGQPFAFMVALSAPATTQVSLVEEIIAGVAEDCAKHNVAFVGGDTKESAELSVVGSAFGSIRKDLHFDRRKAKVGDRIVLAGCVGGYVGAYWICSKGDGSPDAAAYLAHPSARWREATLIAATDSVRSACDLSDGLIDAVSSLLSPGLGVVVTADDLPFHPLAVRAASESHTRLLNYAFGVGDWGIAYAIDPSFSARVEQLRGSGLELFDIGEVVDRPGVQIATTDGFLVADLSATNEHFRSRMEDQGDWFTSLVSGQFLRSA
jgi:thiamine-monophosphate kinase